VRVNRLGTFHRRALYWVAGTLFVTGVFWALLHYLPRQLGLDESSAMAGAAFTMKLHGAAAMLALVLIGTLVPGHISHGLENNINKASGIGMLFLLGLLVVSGYFLYYAGSDEARQVNSFVHLAAGIALPATIVVHVMNRLRLRYPAVTAGAPK